ncbi:MAG: hypothetical protein KZQ77_15440 [Candidatus Thiodiazotropha sp. (ex Notomyrtea botanica)]|nr:hypothetical protein [Candidatus Thiodiazotropha sp. (ex Notomyrtea botanica)]
MEFIICNGTWDTSTGICSGSLQVMPYGDVLTTFDLSLLDSTILASAFGSGFILVGSVLMIGIGLREFLNFIKR